MQASHILMMDDDPDFGELIVASAAEQGIRCVLVANTDMLLAELNPDVSLIVLDLVMPETDGIEVLRMLGEQNCKTGILLMSGAVGERVLETAAAVARSYGLNTVGHLKKPFRFEQLRGLINSPTVERGSSAIAAATKRIGVEDSDLRTAVEQDEFILHYQPQIEIATGQVIGIEALVRWQHPTLGLIYPDSFIARCERLELISLLGGSVANRGLAEISPLREKWQLTLSINVSPFSLLDLSLPDAFVALARKYKWKPDDIIIEVTENAVVHDVPNTLDVLARLRVRGFQLSIDDFGVGYSMMEQLHNVPATEIKIDRSFVMGMNKRSNHVTVVKSIEIGHELGLRVVAEGVETLEQFEFLKLNRCDVAQGYAFSKPLPLGTLTTWLENYKSPVEHL